jgi:hypothetical protein
VQKFYNEIADNIKDQIGTSWYIPSSNKTYKILEFHKEHGVFGQYYFIAEDQSITYSTMNRFIFGRKHPLIEINMLNFVEGILKKEILPINNSIKN